MRKILYILTFCVLLCPLSLKAQSLVVRQTYRGGEMTYLGLPDYPPFSYFEGEKYNSIFLQPLAEFATAHHMEFFQHIINHSPVKNTQQAILLTETCRNQLFIGAYPETKMFRKLHLLYPAAISNPIHVITLPETNEKIKSTADLQNLKGLAIKTEYFSDFVMRKIQPLNLEYAETPIEAYEKLFTGEVDYIIGSIYYNKIEASKYGIEQYLSYSSSPIFKIPVFLATCEKLPRLNAFEKALKEEMRKPEFSEKLKQIISAAINQELEKNQGVVPPAFAKKVVEGPSEEELKAMAEEEARKKAEEEKDLQEKKLEEEQKLDNILNEM